VNKVVFSSWSGKVVDNRGQGKDISAENLEFPRQYDGHKLKAFMSWKGLVVADDKVNVVDMAHSYLKEVQKLSCGECSVGYLGVKVMLDTLARIVSGEGAAKDIELLRWLGTGIKRNTKCDFCALAVTPVVDTLDFYEAEYAKLIAGKAAVPKSVYITRVTAPCMEACPAYQDAPGYIELIANRRYEEALEVIRKTNCFAGVTGRACVAFCETNCVRGDIDSPIAIRALKRVPADYEAVSGSVPSFKKRRARGVKVVVIGAGPAGLAASYNLMMMGYKVTVYDEQTSAGGMAWVGIPAYRLPKDVLAREVDIIKRLGVEVKLNTRVGRDITLEQLFSQGFKAIFMATGAHIGRELGIEAQGRGVIDGVEFLHKVNKGERVAVKDRVIIVGGGNVAIDCARTCLRLGFKEVTILYRRSRAEMPARRDEVEAVEKEGAKIVFLAAPVRILAEGGGITGVECIRMELGEPDASGRRRPIPIKGSEFVIETDMVISAIGEKPDLSFIKGKPINITKQETVAVDLYSYQTSLPGVFAGGDCVTGPATLIEAIAAGNRAAKAIDQYLQSGKASPTEEYLLENWLHNVALNRERNGGIVAKRLRRSPEELAIQDRRLNFNEVEQCFTPDVAVKEAERCLRCYRVMLMAVAD
jgi:formate dehydrogenase beta subunit